MKFQLIYFLFARTGGSESEREAKRIEEKKTGKRPNGDTRGVPANFRLVGRGDSEKKVPYGGFWTPKFGVLDYSSKRHLLSEQY